MEAYLNYHFCEDNLEAEIKPREIMGCLTGAVTSCQGYSQPWSTEEETVGLNAPGPTPSSHHYLPVHPVPVPNWKPKARELILCLYRSVSWDRELGGKHERESKEENGRQFGSHSSAL